MTEETPEGEEHPVTDTENKENEVEEVGRGSKRNDFG